MLPISTSSFPDETLYSRASRHHILRDNPTPVATYKELFDTKPFLLTSLMPPFVERLARKFSDSSGEVLHSIFEENTLYPLLKLFSGTRLANVSSQDLSGFKIISGPKRTLGDSGKTFLCPDCVEEDMDIFGVPYIHRTHQIPGVLVCWKHGNILLDSCSHCACPFETIREFFTMPWRDCVCDHSVQSMNKEKILSNNDTAIGYAKFAHDLLQKQDIEVNAKVLSEAYRSKAISLGHKYGTSMSRKSLHESIEEFYGQELLSKMDDAYAKGRISGWYSHFVAIAAHNTPLSRHLLTAYYLFRDAEHFLLTLRDTEARILQETGLETKKTKRKCTTKGNATKRKKKLNVRPAEEDKPLVLKQLEKIYLDNPQYELSDYWKNHRVLLKKLVGKHKKNFEQFKELVSNDKGDSSLDKISCIGELSEDGVLATKLGKVVNNLYLSTNKPEKMTKHRALRAAHINASKYLHGEGYPIIKRKLNECVESQWHFHARRVLWAKLTIGDDVYSISDITRISGINHSVAVKLDEYFKDVNKKKKLESGIVSHILREYSIGHDWVGPCPEEKFYLNGRNYVAVSDRKK